MISLNIILVNRTTGLIEAIYEKTAISEAIPDYSISDNFYILGNELELKVLNTFFPTGDSFPTLSQIETWLGSENRFRFYLDVNDGTQRYGYRYKSYEYDEKTELYNVKFESIEAVFIQLLKNYPIAGSQTSTTIGYAIEESIVQLDNLREVVYSAGVSFNYLDERYGFHLQMFLEAMAGKRCSAIWMDSDDSDIFANTPDQSDYSPVLFRGLSYDMTATSVSDAIEYTFREDTENSYNMSIYDIFKLALMSFNAVCHLEPTSTLTVGQQNKFKLHIASRIDLPGSTLSNPTFIELKYQANKNQIDFIDFTGNNYTVSIGSPDFLINNTLTINMGVSSPQYYDEEDESGNTADSRELYLARAEYDSTDTYDIYDLQDGTTNYGWEVEMDNFYSTTGLKGHVISGKLFEEIPEFFDLISYNSQSYAIVKIKPNRSVTEFEAHLFS